MVMNPNHLQYWVHFGLTLYIFLILVQFWSIEIDKSLGFQAFFF